MQTWLFSNRIPEKDIILTTNRISQSDSKQLRLALCAVFLLVGLLMVGCAADDLIDSNYEPDNTLPQLTITVDQVANVERATITVEQDGVALISEQALQLNGDAWSIELNDLSETAGTAITINGYDSADPVTHTSKLLTRVRLISPGYSLSLQPVPPSSPVNSESDWLQYQGSNNYRLASSHLWEINRIAATAVDSERALFFWNDSRDGNQLKTQIVQLMDDNSTVMGNIFNLPKTLFQPHNYIWTGAVYLGQDIIALSHKTPTESSEEISQPIIKLLEISNTEITDPGTGVHEYIVTQDPSIDVKTTHKVISISSTRLLSVFDIGDNSIGLSLLSWDGSVLNIIDETQITRADTIDDVIDVVTMDQTTAVIGWSEQTEDSSGAVTASSAMGVLIDISSDAISLSSPALLLEPENDPQFQGGVQLRRITDDTVLILAGEFNDDKTPRDGEAWLQTASISSNQLSAATPLSLGSEPHSTWQNAIEIIDERYGVIIADSYGPPESPAWHATHYTFEMISGVMSGLYRVVFTGIEAWDNESVLLENNRLLVHQSSLQPDNNGYLLVQP